MSTLALGLDRTVLELKMYSREKEAVFFSFLLPILLLALFSTIFGGQFEGGDGTMTAGRFFLPGMVAAGVLLTSFQTMAMSVATERDDGTLKRLRATPMPPLAYFLGKVGLVAVSSLAQVALLLLVARVAYGVELPTDASAWGRFASVFALGVLAGHGARDRVLLARLGPLGRRGRHRADPRPAVHLRRLHRLQRHPRLAPSRWPRSSRSSGSPRACARRSTRTTWRPLEMAGSWETGRTLLVLAAWTLVGLVLCVTTFKWFKRGTT